MADEPENIAIQSGVLPIAGDKVVLITARRSGRWIIPKGYVEEGMSSADSAAKEAFEEAGIVGKVLSHPIGTYRYRRPSGVFTVQVFPLEVEKLLDQWQEMHFRQRRVVTPSEALELISQEELKTLVAHYFAHRITP
ncbi:MAG: NUDIX hydrolase [Chlorobiaceae bacterium]|nr:NUDIX hydrolase [Chlorobiaceae bacterium]